MRAIWKGAVSFGLVNVPVRVFGATQEHDIRFHQVHRVDGGRIRMKRICTVCGEEVPYDQLARGYESTDGRAVILTDDDFAGLPLATSREIDVLEFVPTEQVDPILFDRTYYLEPEARATKPYVLLREALEATDRMAVVKVALRQRETLAVLRVRERIIVMQTLLWPDEVRAVGFDVLDADVDVRPQELAMAESLVESLSADFAPEAYEDQYAKAVASLVEAKLEGVEPPPAPGAEAASSDVVDLLTALQASVERARAARGQTATQSADAAPAPAEEPTRRRSSRTSASTQTAEPSTERPARKTATKTATKAGTKAGTKARAAKDAEPAHEEATPAKPATAKRATKKAAAKKAGPRKSA